MARDNVESWLAAHLQQVQLQLLWALQASWRPLAPSSLQGCAAAVQMDGICQTLGAAPTGRAHLCVCGTAAARASGSLARAAPWPCPSPEEATLALEAMLSLSTLLAT